MTDSAEYIFRNSDWITYLFIGLFGLISVMRFLYHERIVHTFGLFLSKRYLSYYFSSEANAIMNVYQALLFFIQISVIGLLVYFTNESYKFILLEPGFEGFLKIILFIKVSSSNIDKKDLLSSS